jgi:hypothetical protein
MAGFVTTGDYSEDLHELASGEATTFLGVWVILPIFLGILARMLARSRRYLLPSEDELGQGGGRLRSSLRVFQPTSPSD